MRERIERRARRAREGERIGFLDPGATIAGTSIGVQAARDGAFAGSAIPADLQCQWIQGTGPGAKPDTPVPRSIRNVAYALLSGADGWMFDGEDALGQITTMSLDNQRNLRLASAGDPVFLQAAEEVAAGMNAWGESFFGRAIVPDWKRQLGFTTRIFRARGLHLDDRHVRETGGSGFSASIVDTALYVTGNYRRMQEQGSSLVLYLPKIQTAEEAALWNDILDALEGHLGLAAGTIKTYVLVEQLEASYQLMEIRAALGRHFVGYNTGRWDYINSVADAMAWDASFINPNIDAILMTYGYMRNYEDRVRRAVNTPGRQRQLRAVAGRHGTQHPGRLRGRRGGLDEQGGGRRRARAAGRRQRQVGGALEDGAHRASGVGARGGGQPARTRVPVADLHRGRRGGTDRAGGGAAHGARGARPAERGAAVRQRLRPGHAGRGAETGRLLRRRRRALPDGGHGHRRDPPQHPVGVAAQGRRAHRGRSRDRPEGRHPLHGARSSSACWPRSTPSFRRPPTATCTTTPSAPRCRWRARSPTSTCATR